MTFRGSVNMATTQIPTKCRLVLELHAKTCEWLHLLLVFTFDLYLHNGI